MHHEEAPDEIVGIAEAVAALLAGGQQQPGILDAAGSQDVNPGANREIVPGKGLDRQFLDLGLVLAAIEMERVGVQIDRDARRLAERRSIDRAEP